MLDQKNRHSSSNIKKYMIVLISIFIPASIIINIYFFKVIDNISIESDLYQQIKNSKDLKADILPPKLYIVESYLILEQIANEHNSEKVQLLLERMQENRTNYFEYYKRWQTNMNDPVVSELLQDSNSYVTQFYQIYDEKIVPALKENDYKTMTTIINSEVIPLFEQHREIIDNMSDILEANNYNTENHAKSAANRSKMILLSVCILFLLTMIDLCLIIFKKVINIERTMVHSQDETELANERLETMVDGLRKFKHNYDNILASINGYVIRNDQEGLRLYLDEIIEEKAKNEMVNFFKLNFIKNPAVTGLIISKMLYAEGHGVEFILKVHSEVSEIAMKTSHLCEILGVLLDNAIEAAEESEEKRIYFSIEETDESFVFEIKNTVGLKPNKIKMFERGYSTKGENRGAGLSILKEMIGKYEYVLLNSTIADDYVEQDLIILKQAIMDKSTRFTDVL